MRKEEFVRGMKFLGEAYNKEFTPEQVGVWFNFFENESFDSFRSAVKRIVAKSKYLPSIAELKQEIALITNPMLQLDCDEEWDSIIKALRRYGYYRYEEAMDSLKPQTRQIARTIGWYNLCTSENIEWQRKTFKELFNAKQAQCEEIYSIGDGQLTLSEIVRKSDLMRLQNNQDHPLLETYE